MKLKVIDGGLKQGVWLRDRSAYSDEEIAAANERFRELAERYPQCRSFFEYFIWDIKPNHPLSLVQ